MADEIQEQGAGDASAKYAAEVEGKTEGGDVAETTAPLDTGDEPLETITNPDLKPIEVEASGTSIYKQPQTAMSAVVVGPGGKADLDLDELNVLTVKLGGRLWRAVEPTIGVSKKLAEALPAIQGAGDDDDDDDDSAIRGQAALDALASIAPQVQHVLRDPVTGEKPDIEFIEQYLTGRNFGILMERLNTTAKRGNRKGA